MSKDKILKELATKPFKSTTEIAEMMDAYLHDKNSKNRDINCSSKQITGGYTK